MARGPAVAASGRRRWLPRRRPLLFAFLLIVFVTIVWPPLFIVMNCYGSGSQPARPVAAEVKDIAGYGRDESFTYLTLPEWFIVYSTEEHARFIARDRPSRFPYFSSIGQYWGYYRAMCEITTREYPFSMGYNVALGVIGQSFTIETAVRGLYEKTIGRVTEWLATNDTPEDAFAIRTAREYGAFLHTVPFYQFPFGAKLRSLWRDTPLFGPHVIRKWERRLALTGEYGTKAVYGWLIRQATTAAYGAEDLQIHARIEKAPPAVFANTQVKRVKQLGPAAFVVVMPRYEAFTQIALKLQPLGVQYIDIAGNDEILLTAIAPRDLDYGAARGSIVASDDILTEPSRKRIGVRAPVASLHDIIAYLQGRGATIEHLYDY